MSIYLRLAGGLGNQLFQIAAAALISTNSRQPVKIITSSLKKYKQKREPVVLSLISQSQWISNEKLWKTRILSSIAELARAGKWIPFSSVNDKNWKEYAINSRSQNLFMDGYFQEKWNFEDFYRAVKLITIKPAAPNSYQLLSGKEVVIHVRGKDFLRLKKFQVVDYQFYLKCISEALDLGWSKFVIVSDDEEYSAFVKSRIESEFQYAKVRLFPSVSIVEDFDVLRIAPARIIGNSTFAWWGSALANQQSCTWSPGMFTLDKKRDFFLPCERVIAR